jgi:hypothetical protein
MSRIGTLFSTFREQMNGLKYQPNSFQDLFFRDFSINPHYKFDDQTKRIRLTTTTWLSVRARTTLMAGNKLMVKIDPSELWLSFGTVKMYFMLSIDNPLV